MVIGSQYLSCNPILITQLQEFHMTISAAAIAGLAAGFSFALTVWVLDKIYDYLK